MIFVINLDDTPLWLSTAWGLQGRRPPAQRARSSQGARRSATMSGERDHEHGAASQRASGVAGLRSRSAV
jgi:hypothetical protein